MAKDKKKGQSGEGGLDLWSLKFGTLNDFRDDDINDSGDRRRGNPLSFLAQSLAKAYGVDTLKSVSDYRGIVMRVDKKPKSLIPTDRSEVLNNYLKQSLGDKIAGMFSGDDDELVPVYKVYIPELEVRPPPDGEDDPVLDTYFDVYDGRVFPEERTQIDKGTVVTVQFEDFKNLTNPRIVASEKKPLIIKGLTAGGSVLQRLGAHFKGSPEKEKISDGGSAAKDSPTANEGPSTSKYKARSKPGAEATPAQISFAEKFGFEVAVVQAIEAVESGGRPAAVRFEPHLWHRHYKKLGLTEAQRDAMPFTRNPDNKPPFSKVRSETNETAFNKALEINPSAALYCTSFGLYQVMGYQFPNYKNKTKAREHVVRFRQDPVGVSYELLEVWFGKNSKAQQAAKTKDWRELARRYNGPANVAVYAPRLSREYAAFTGTEPTV